jgi:hypothetical protein
MQDFSYRDDQQQQRLSAHPHSSTVKIGSQHSQAQGSAPLNFPPVWNFFTVAFFALFFLMLVIF